MFSLNESNRFVVCREATDMRKGPNMLCGEIRQCGLDPANGDVYVFIGASRHILKLLVWENGGYAVYYKRLEAGRISPKVFHHGGGGFRPMGWDELVLFMMGISVIRAGHLDYTVCTAMVAEFPDRGKAIFRRYGYHSWVMPLYELPSERVNLTDYHLLGIFQEDTLQSTQTSRTSAYNQNCIIL